MVFHKKKSGRTAPRRGRNTLRLALIGAAAVAVVIAAIVGVRALSSDSAPLDVPGFLAAQGWGVELPPTEIKTVKIPPSFSAAYQQYNDLQKKQGFDLSRYKSKEVTSYTYKVTNYSYNGDVFATVLVYNGDVIGGDLCSYALDGFMTAVKKK
ncbi:MAG: DUF4830 domain-containing protein [Oscillospiraceae bacterium]|jgi:hypothetical protein|nr:DUF4830 domain-containing protein [Oscillospiraceae bacterium]